MEGWTNSFLIPMTRKLKAGLFKEFETRTGFDRFEQFFHLCSVRAWFIICVRVHCSKRFFLAAL